LEGIAVISLIDPPLIDNIKGAVGIDHLLQGHIGLGLPEHILELGHPEELTPTPLEEGPVD
jgi:hypothetical protein